MAVVEGDAEIRTGGQGVEVFIGRGNTTEVDCPGLVVEVLICVCYI